MKMMNTENGEFFYQFDIDGREFRFIVDPTTPKEFLENLYREYFQKYHGRR